MHDVTRSGTPPHPVDNTDWLKTVAIICVSAGHIGFFFIENELWWSVFGRFAAPPFFFLVGTRKAVLSRFTGYGSASF